MIVRVLAKEGHEVVGLDIGAAPREDFGKGVRWARMDMTNFEEVVATFSASKPDVVFNLSFMRENVPRIAMKLNVLGRTIVSRRHGCDVKRVIYASSIAVNGRQTNYGDRPIRETDPPAPRKQYDTHKVFTSGRLRNTPRSTACPSSAFVRQRFRNGQDDRLGRSCRLHRQAGKG